ncbi:hypothetical protein C2E21_4080 [Chlorella sorokiniana]|uniref:Uncharacterized protein n=1 Tax=Chlorella sorokiniana TaxID=3076 RepID=A0A2P6TTR1_CHLSO|nr:hypothetical protein C2E21_4080 [Chlorella sorokiniana]|eukprot:PRW57457.1 hypothetical protein C2E21_4080 [Chlorella sorokiniana]
MELWPAGLQSPTVYYMIRERQLAFQIRAVAAEGPAAWRTPANPAAAAPSALLQRRGLRPLAVLVPHTATGIDANDTAVYVRSINVMCWRPATAALAAPCPLAAPCRPAPPAPLQRLATPPTLEEQPAKRSRLISPPRPVPGMAALAAAPRAAGHLIAPDMRSQAGSCSACSSASSARYCPSSCPPASAPVVLAMPPLAHTSCPPRQHQHSSSGSPLIAWLQKIKHMLSPRSQQHTPVYIF